MVSHVRSPSLPRLKRRWLVEVETGVSAALRRALSTPEGFRAARRAGGKPTPEAEEHRYHVWVEAADHQEAERKVEKALRDAGIADFFVCASGPAPAYEWISVLLFAVGGFALTVGGHDAFFATGLAGRSVGGVLAIGGALMWTGVYASFFHRPWAPWVNLVAGFFAVVTGGSLLAAQAISHEHWWLAPFWVAIALIGTTAVLLHGKSCGPSLVGVLRRVQILTAAGGIVALLQFWYATYAPAKAPVHLGVTSSLEEVASTAKGRTLAVKIGISNPSQTKVLVVDSLYKVTAQKETFSAANENAVAKNLAQAAQSRAVPPPAFDTFTKESKGELLRGGRLLDHDWSLEPGGSYTVTFLTHLPANGFDLARLFVLLWVTTPTGLRLAEQPSDGPAPVSHSGNDYVRTGWRVEETSWIHSITRSDKKLWTYWLVHSDKDIVPPDLSVYITEKKADTPNTPETQRRKDQIDDEYRLAYTLSTAELALQPVG